MKFRTLTTEELVRHGLHQAKTELEKELVLRLLELVDHIKPKEKNPAQMELDFGSNA
jgi:hypothetical protein